MGETRECSPMFAVAMKGCPVAAFRTARGIEDGPNQRAGEAGFEQRKDGSRGGAEDGEKQREKERIGPSAKARRREGGGFARRGGVLHRRRRLSSTFAPAFARPEGRCAPGGKGLRASLPSPRLRVKSLFRPKAYYFTRRRKGAKGPAPGRRPSHFAEDDRDRVLGGEPAAHLAASDSLRLRVPSTRLRTSLSRDYPERQRGCGGAASRYARSSPSTVACCAGCSGGTGQSKIVRV